MLVNFTFNYVNLIFFLKNKSRSNGYWVIERLSLAKNIILIIKIYNFNSNNRIKEIKTN